MTRATTADPTGVSLSVDENGVGWLIFDLPEEKVNKLTLDVLERLSVLIAEAASRQDEMVALVVASGKPAHFIAGADVHQIAAVTEVETGRRLAARVQAIFQALADRPFPTAAAIAGPCMGGGTELALACDLRIAADTAAVSIGLPEVRLGILPGFGGTQRLPRLLGLSTALDLILAGRSLDARRALRVGLVDRVVPAALLEHEAALLALEATRRGVSAIARRPGRKLLQRFLDGNPFGRRLLVSAARKKVLGQTGGHYPAPLRALESTANASRMSLVDGLAREAELVGELVTTPVSKNLIGLFLAGQAVKKQTGVTAPVEPARVERVGLLGAGTMGGGLAWLMAEHDLPVRMKDVRIEALSSGLEAAAKIFDRAVRKRRMMPLERERKMGHISPTLDYSGFSTVDLVLEAVVEKLEVKWTVLEELEAVIAPGTIIASNTSSLPISRIASRSSRPERLVGMHFFNPVHRMPLVEVIRGDATSDQAVATVYSLACRLGKTPVVVRDRPGFLINRLLAPYLSEAAILVAEGASIAAVDQAFRRFGMPMGPLMLYDQVGLDVAGHVARILADAFGERLGRVDLLDPLLDKGWLGKKSGVGLYRHTGKAPTANATAQAMLQERAGGAGAAGSDEITERCILRMIDEGARCLEEEVVANAEDLDLAIVFGTGFPPFRGGLMRYADTLGPTRIVEAMNALTATHGARFSPCNLLREMASAGTPFRRPFPQR